MSVARCRPAASGRRPRAGLLVGLVVLVSACASAPPTPAPVENRTRPQAPAPAPRPAAAAGSAPAPAPARPAPVPAPAPAAAAPVRPREPAVQTAPVRPGSVEARPLPPPPSPSNLLREPRVTKRPFSDAALAEMRAADAAAGGAADAAGTTPPPAGTMPPAGAPATGMASGAAVPPPPAGTPPASAPAAERPGPVGNIELDWPLRGAILQGFGEGRSTGLAIAASAGDPILAAGDGRVIFSGPGPRGYGNLIIIKHDADLLSVYGHGRTLLVKEGQTVRKGQRIAEAGDSGTDRPRLLFEIRRGGKPVDPAGLLPPR